MEIRILGWYLPLIFPLSVSIGTSMDVNPIELNKVTHLDNIQLDRISRYPFTSAGRSRESRNIHV
jgi:hypothetical protein